MAKEVCPTKNTHETVEFSTLRDQQLAMEWVEKLQREFDAKVASLTKERDELKLKLDWVDAANQGLVEHNVFLSKERGEWKVAADLLGNRLIQAELRVESLTKAWDLGEKVKNQFKERAEKSESRVESLEKALRELRRIVDMSDEEFELQEKYAAKAATEIADVLANMLAVGGENFASVPMECYCGGVMDAEGELDEVSPCLLCIAREKLGIARKAIEDSSGSV